MTADTARRCVAACLCGGALSACAAIYSPTAPDENWTVYESRRFSLYARPASFCASQGSAIADVLETQYDHTVAVLELRSSAPISVFLYNSGDELTPKLPNTYSGVAFPDTSAVHVVCLPPLGDNLRALLTHEVNHVIINQGLGRAGTSFMNEGLASALVADRFGPIGPSFLFEWTARNRTQLLPLAILTDDANWNSSEIAYKTSASFLAWLLQQYGRDRLKQLYYARSSEMAARAVEVYGQSLQTLEAEWLATVGSRTVNTAP